MKALSIIWSVYLLLLAVVPCMDSSLDKSLPAPVEISKHGHEHGDPNNCMDLCTPFCCCQCCGTFYTTVELFIIDTRLVFPATDIPTYEELQGVPFKRSIQHPPNV